MFLKIELKQLLAMLYAFSERMLSQNVNDKRSVLRNHTDVVSVLSVRVYFVWLVSKN